MKCLEFSMKKIGSDRIYKNEHNCRSDPIRSRAWPKGSRSDPDPGILDREPDRRLWIAIQYNTDFGPVFVLILVLTFWQKNIGIGIGY